VQKWILLISIAFVFAGCADLKKSEQLERIDSMETQLESWKSELNEFDSEQLETWKSQTAENVLVLKQLESDTIPLDAALKIDTYRNLQMKLMMVQTQKAVCESDISKVEKRLKKLRNDINKGNGRRDKYDEYLDREESEMEVLQTKFTFYRSTYKTVKNELPVAQEKINELISERIETEEVQ